MTGPGQVPLHTAIEEDGGNAYPMPEPLFRPALRQLFRFGFAPWPEGAIDFLKYPVTLSGENFVEATKFRPLFGLDEIFQALRR